MPPPSRPARPNPSDWLFVRPVGSRLASVSLGKVMADLARMKDILAARGKLGRIVKRPYQLTGKPLAGT